MRGFMRPGAFDLTINMLTLFGYSDARGEDLQVLHNVLASLCHGGVLLMDLAGKETLAHIFQTPTSEVLPASTRLVHRHGVFDDWTRSGGSRP